jgi:hypothetical protein
MLQHWQQIMLSLKVNQGFSSVRISVFPVLRIRIRMFLGPLDPDPEPPIIRKTYCFVTFFDFLFLKNYVNAPSKSKKQKFFFFN